MLNRRTIAGCLCRLALFVVGCQPRTAPSTEPQTKTTEAGAKQPLSGFSVHMDAFHAMKGDPGHMLEVHHYCRQTTPDLAECVLFDGDDAKAHMTGVEYIVSEKVFESLPGEERKLWHPHNYEILSGQMVFLGLSPGADKRAAAAKINSYGKVWHTWRGGLSTRPSDELPMGSADLGWSINADGELPPSMLDARDSRLRISTGERRAARVELIFAAHPQEGVDALAKSFPERRPIPGVADKRATPRP